MTKGLTKGTRAVCDDNSGAKIVEVIGVKHWRSRARRYPSLSIGDIAIVAVKKGTPAMRKKVEKAVVIRQRREFRRPSGMRVSFEDNAVALVDEEGQPKGTEIKGVIAREVAERYSKVAGIAASVV